MNQSNNALLSPIEWEDFQKTPLFQVLEKRQDDWAEISRFLNVDNPKDLDMCQILELFFTHPMSKLILRKFVIFSAIMARWKQKFRPVQTFANVLPVCIQMSEDSLSTDLVM